MRKVEETIKSSIRKTYMLRTAWITVIVCSLLFIGIVSVVSSSTLLASYSASRTNSDSLFAPITGWDETAPLPEAIAGKNAVAYDEDNDGNDDYIFFVGGRSANGLPTNKVLSGAIGSDGKIAGWTEVSSLTLPLFLHSLDATDTHLFVIGGWKGSEPTQRSVYRAEFRENGTLGPWTLQGEYSTKVSQHGSTIVNDYIYVIGGWEGSFAYANVNFARINSNGTLGEWTSTVALPTQMRRIATVSFNGKIYVTGGVDGTSAPLNTVYVGDVGSDGQILSWTPLTPLPQAMFYHRAVIHDGNLVVLGGKNVNNGPDLQVVYSASINADGTTGAWNVLPSLPKGLFRFAAVPVQRWGSDYIVTMGGGQGANANPTLQANVYYSSLPATPTPTPTPTLTPTPTPPVSMDINVSNDPGRWLAPGEAVTYVIDYQNNGPGDASETVVKGKIPEFTEYVIGSANPPESALTSVDAGGEISWSLGTLGDDQSGQIEYQVRRVIPERGQQGAIDVGLIGPTSGIAAQPLTYTVQITNLVGGGLGSTQVEVGIPEEATYLGSSNGGALQDDGTILWVASGLPEGTWSLSFILSANASFVLHDYEVQATVIGSDQIACCGVGDNVLVTTINGLPVIGAGDGTTIINDDIEISWNYNGNQTGTAVATSIQNPRLATNKLFLPYLIQ